MSSTDDDTMLDEAWLAAPRKRSRFRMLTAFALLGALCFLGGALTQKNLGAEDAAAASGLPAGLPEGFTPGSGGFPGGLPGGGAQGSDAPSTDAGGDAEERVIGTVVEKSGDVWVVEDLGGTRHDVTVTDDTRIVREASLTSDRVRAGDRVQITGTSRGDRLRAADVTLR